MFFTGRVKPPIGELQAASTEFLLRDGQYPKTLNRDVSKLSPNFNQAGCGSCVYAASNSCWMDTQILHGLPFFFTSPQYEMDCASREWMCGGSFFSKWATGMAAKGGAALLTEYPYNARNQSCQGQPKLYGKILEGRIIDNSHRSIIAALNDNRTIVTTIGAGGPFMNYRSGTFTQCQNVATNHEMEGIDYDCETSVDANGKCAFDANGMFPRGVGKIKLRQSWKLGNEWWGDGGFIWMKLTTPNGARCNNVAEEVGIIDVGSPIPPTPVVPQVFTMDGPSMVITVTLATGIVATVPEAKDVLQPFLDNLK